MLCSLLVLLKLCNNRQVQGAVTNMTCLLIIFHWLEDEYVEMGRNSCQLDIATLGGEGGSFKEPGN